MLPKKAFEYFKKIILLASSFNLFPYSWSWDKKKEKFGVHHNIWSKIKYWSQIFILISYQLFMVGQSWKLGFNESIPLKKKFGVQYLIFTFIGLNYNLLTTLRNHAEFPGLINNFVFVTNSFVAEDGHNKKRINEKPKDQVSRSIALIFIPGLLLAVANTFGALKHPDSPLLLTSLAPNPRELHLALRLVYLCFHGYLQCLQYLMPVFHLVTVICYVDGLAPMISKLSMKHGPTMNYESTGVLDIERIYHYYHELRVLQSLFNSCYSQWALGAQTFLTVFCISNIFQVGALHNVRGIFAGLIQIMLVRVIFRHLARIYELSAPVVESWKKTSQALWFHKFTRACQPCRVVVGSFYFADYTLVLTMIAIISTNSASMIVAYKDT